jgi:hypothetical protein
LFGASVAALYGNSGKKDQRWNAPGRKQKRLLHTISLSVDFVQPPNQIQRFWPPRDNECIQKFQQLFNGSFALHFVSVNRYHEPLFLRSFVVNRLIRVISDLPILSFCQNRICRT